MEFDLGFELVGEDMEGARTDLSDAGPAALFADRPGYLRAGRRWFREGDHAGWVHGTAVLTHHDRLVCQLTFSFEADPDDTIVVHGVLPREGDGLGRGRLAVTGGTGKFHKAAGTVASTTRNPKRFSFTL